LHDAREKPGDVARIGPSGLTIHGDAAEAEDRLVHDLGVAECRRSPRRARPAGRSAASRVVASCLLHVAQAFAVHPESPGFRNSHF
jgi:hypothetical protein